MGQGWGYGRWCGSLAVTAAAVVCSDGGRS